MSIIEKRKKRVKQTAEVFTPEWLAQQMLDKISDDFWNDSTKTMLEPSCGDGIFVTLSIEKRLKYNQPLEKIIHNTYGLDIMRDNIRICRKKVLDIVARELSKEYKMASKKDYKLFEERFIKLAAVVWYNIRRVNDTLTFNFDEFKPYLESKPSLQKKSESEARKFIQELPKAEAVWKYNSKKNKSSWATD
jgi:hypothetical protein